MFRKNTWEQGVYIDNHKKYECRDCNKQFIVGEESLKDCKDQSPICPYCGSGIVECTVWTLDEDLEELEDDMGCLAIKYENESEITEE